VGTQHLALATCSGGGFGVGALAPALREAICRDAPRARASGMAGGYLPRV
jgi:hypothetical protein